jgi:hypothetical protein
LGHRILMRHRIYTGNDGLFASADTRSQWDGAIQERGLENLKRQRKNDLPEPKEQRTLTPDEIIKVRKRQAAVPTIDKCY